ncbi:allantoate amidohydrolase [Pimelobacter simplex]|uniref:N-formylglutamate deformylase [alternative form] n=1 Tax=Nocardioides simplex TaxID=2045 RepID=A0A0A1DTP5_NOCSI|nr:allantoate amidohydrolase [Pimelobacter simplex]AIY19962.2 N-formylglutamate deformylase [alternative form] [Pimelobacter simplex]GEB13493.1 Zn-dependent hydrolase [Pimelobacter simplex]SFM72748.1 N-carbamoyl-L-amino-acid hydrolase [Pimelobacter simplex]
MTQVADFEQMWRDLAPVGRSASSGGYFRQPWLSAELELRAWFREAATARGLELEEDPFGNLVAWWGPDTGAGKVLTGSHLDSVLDGGAYDGPLGVVSSFAALDLMRSRGVEPTRRLGVSAFVEEEGSRFGRACLGSRLAVGATTWADARELTDRDGVRLGDVIEGGESTLLDGVTTYVELHVEQGRGLIDLDAPVGVHDAIWPHGRYRYDIAGRADHAGTTRMEDRADPMLTYAMTALAANKQARLSGQRATFGRIDVRPNGTNAVPSHVTAWLDARAASDDALAALVAAVEKQAADRAGRDGTTVTVTPESVSGEVAFDVALRDEIAARLGGVPVLPTQAGHDAGILQDAGIPTAMLFVRNPSGVSHSPYESAETADCLAGVEALADALTGLVAP